VARLGELWDRLPRPLDPLASFKAKMGHAAHGELPPGDACLPSEFFPN
jgi:hypothetical protein